MPVPLPKWHETDLPSCPLNGRYRGESRHDTGRPFRPKKTESEHAPDHRSRPAEVLSPAASHVKIGEVPHKHSRAHWCLRWSAQNRRIFGGARAMGKRRAAQAGSAVRIKQVFCPPNPNEFDSTHLTVASRATLGTTSSGMAGSGTV